MARILRRPMFRRGGMPSSEGVAAIRPKYMGGGMSGIMTGINPTAGLTPRVGYKVGTEIPENKKNIILELIIEKLGPDASQEEIALEYGKQTGTGGYKFSETAAGKGLEGIAAYGPNSAIVGATDLVGVPLNTIGRAFGYNPGFSGTKLMDKLTGGRYSEFTGYDPDKARFLGFETDAKTGPTTDSLVTDENIQSILDSKIDEGSDPNKSGIKGNEEKLTGDMESDLMRAYKEYAPIFEKELGVSSEDTKKQLYMQLAKFGAGLAAQPGGDLVGAIGKAAEKPLEGAGETIKDQSTAKRQAKLLALQTAIKEDSGGPLQQKLNTIAKAQGYTGEDRLKKAYVDFKKLSTNNTTATAADVKRYAEAATKFGLVKNDQERFIMDSKNLAADYPKLVGKFNEELPEEWENEENVGAYFVTPQGQFIRVVKQKGKIVRIAMGETGFEDKPKTKSK